jgi:hypothetical protein
MKAKRREAKEERRAARKIARLEPASAADDEPAEDQPTDTAGQAEDGGEPRD